MNTHRFWYNPPVLLELIYKEYHLTENNLADIFNKHPRVVKNWTKGLDRPDDDILSAMILAYQWVRFWKPIKNFFRLITFTVVSNLKKLLKKSK